MIDEKTNLKLIDKKISELVLEGNTIIAFDFDELITHIHLTSTVVRKISNPLDTERLKKLDARTFKGIDYLNSLTKGVNFSDYEKLRDKIVKDTEWNKEIKKAITELMKSHSIIIITSGLKDVCYAKLKEIGFNPVNILGGTNLEENGKVAKTDLIISTELKGYIVKKLKENYKVISVGHSAGDKDMLSNSDVSIAFNPDIPDLAKYKVHSAKEILEIIKKK